MWQQYRGMLLCLPDLGVPLGCEVKYLLPNDLQPYRYMASANNLMRFNSICKEKTTNTHNNMLKNIMKIYTNSPKQNLDAILRRSKKTTKDEWGIGLLENVTVVPEGWKNKEHTNYDEIDFSEIEFYDEFILEDIEESLQGEIEETNYKKIEMTYKERAFLNGIIRKVKPKTIVEIGLSAGGSTSVILNAIRDMKNTKLYSFDYNTIWYRDVHFLGQDKGRKTGFLVNQIVPNLVSKWELFTNGVSCKYFDVLPEDGIDICFIDTVHVNPGEHLNILEILPFMKKNSIIIYHDTAYHTLGNANGITNCVSLNTLNGKRIFLKSEKTNGLANIGAVVINDNIENMLFALFSNLSLPWYYKISQEDFIEMFKHFSKYYSPDLVQIYVYYCYFYMNGGLQNKENATQFAEKYSKRT
ncbi:MAG: class I SAM-dependent methyltransferase [Cyclobacteriaceae bacterium]